MNKYSTEEIAYMADWANTLPRKLLAYRTADELFDEEQNAYMRSSSLGNNCCRLLLQFGGGGCIINL